MSNSPPKIAQTINQLEWLIQTDLAHRGIHQIPGKNLCTFTRGNLYRAIKFLAENPGCQVGIVTGFYIPTADPPAPENDGPPGALFIARGLNQLGYPVLLITDQYCREPLQQGIELFANQINNIQFIEFPLEIDELKSFERDFFQTHSSLKCLISIERVGPCHTTASFLKNVKKDDEVDLEQFKKHGPAAQAGECLNMHALSVTGYAEPIHRLFERERFPKDDIFTIGIGDGGNEIGMGSIPWQVIARNILNGLGGKIACRLKTDATIVAGVSNWGGYALMAGLYLYLDRIDDLKNLYDESTETKLIETYFQSKSAVDGTLCYPAMSVDGIEWNFHLNIINFILKMIRVEVHS